jgi:hypothetical protein
MIVKVAYERETFINVNGSYCDPECNRVGRSFDICLTFDQLRTWDHDKEARLRCSECIEAEKRALTKSQDKPTLS